MPCCAVDTRGYAAAKIDQEKAIGDATLGSTGNEIEPHPTCLLSRHRILLSVRLGFRVFVNVNFVLQAYATECRWILCVMLFPPLISHISLGRDSQHLVRFLCFVN